MEPWDFPNSLDDRKRYCVGFMFSPDLTKVVMVRKNRPEWQAGLLNGPGGKIEPGEMSFTAMIREFKEETGVDTSFPKGWQPLARLEYDAAVVWFFFSINSEYHLCTTQTDEPIEIVEISKLMEMFEGVVPNSCWLVQMALSYIRGERATYFRVLEQYR